MTLHVNFLLSVCRDVQRSGWDYADLIKHSVCVERQESSGNGADDMRGFGIIRDAALCAGHGPATVKLFWDLFEKR